MSAFFSGSETALMAINRYRLKTECQKGRASARHVASLLKRPDRLIGLILLGNNLVNILASSLSTIIAIRLYGENGIFAAAVALTFIILIFSEVTPKTLAAIHPERVSYLVVYFLLPLMKLFYPLVWLVNYMANSLLAIMRIRPENSTGDALSREELRTIFTESKSLLPFRHQKMLVNILDMENICVDDIMVPRNEIIGIDLADNWNEIIEQLIHAQFTRLPVYRGDIDQVVGFLHMRKIMNKLARGEFLRSDLEATVREPYFIPSGTLLTTQLVNFQRRRRRVGLVVNEYGDVMGMLTLEDILEEIVGEFTTDPLSVENDIHPQQDGSYLVDGGVYIRELNRALGWQLPTDGPKTLNGLILEYLEQIPQPQTSLMLESHPIEILQVKSNAIKMVRMGGPLVSIRPNQDQLASLAEHDEHSGRTEPDWRSGRPARHEDRT